MGKNEGWGFFTCMSTVSVDCYVEVCHIGRGSHTCTKRKTLFIFKGLSHEIFWGNFRKCKAGKMAVLPVRPYRA